MVVSELVPLGSRIRPSGWRTVRVLEMILSGHEIACIVKARERFGSK
jgi:hypothetical protein